MSDNAPDKYLTNPLNAKFVELFPGVSPNKLFARIVPFAQSSNEESQFGALASHIRTLNNFQLLVLSCLISEVESNESFQLTFETEGINTSVFSSKNFVDFAKKRGLPQLIVKFIKEVLEFEKNNYLGTDSEDIEHKMAILIVDIFKLIHPYVKFIKPMNEYFGMIDEADEASAPTESETSEPRSASSVQNPSTVSAPTASSIELTKQQIEYKEVMALMVKYLKTVYELKTHKLVPIVRTAGELDLSRISFQSIMSEVYRPYSLFRHIKYNNETSSYIIRFDSYRSSLVLNFPDLRKFLILSLTEAFPKANFLEAFKVES